MAAIILVTDLPTAVQAVEMVTAMVAGANAQASRVAPCLVAAPDAWAAETEYAMGDRIALTGGEELQATVAGTSDTVEPTVPDVGETVEDGTVTWLRLVDRSDQLAEAKLILIGAVSRWAEAGAGAFQQQTAGPFSVTTDTRQRSGYNLWPSEIVQLQDICKAQTDEVGAFSVDTVVDCTVHADVCSLNLGAAYCSCGADLASFPLYGI